MFKSKSAADADAMGKGQATGFMSKSKSATVTVIALNSTPAPLTPAELAALYTPDVYRCTLTPELRKLAAAELNEVEGDVSVGGGRDAVLCQLRSWIQRVDYIKDCRIDANFLLRFLRVKKFNLVPAFDMLVSYIVMRQKKPAWFRGLTLADPAVSDLIDRGVVFALPDRDLFGRRVIFTNGGNIDPSRHTSEAVMRAFMLTVEALLEDEENQVRGFAHIFDESDVRLAHLRLWRPSEIKNVLTTCEKSMPMRHRKLDFVALPQILHYLYEIATRVFISAKLRSRITLHRDRTGLLDNLTAPHMDRKLLPAEYGGVTPIRDMIAAFKAELAACGGGRTLARVAALDRMEVDVERMKRSPSSLNLALDDLKAVEM